MATTKEKPLTAAEKAKLGKGNPSHKKAPAPSVIARAVAKGVPLVRGVPVPQTTRAQKRNPPSAEDIKRIAKAEQASVPALLDTVTYVPLEFSTPDYRPRAPEDTRTCVCVNEHRNTCIRVSVGRSKVTYIPMDQEGIMVKKAGIEAFNTEWRLTLSDEHPATAAQRYLMSYQALRHISEEARTLLEGISKQGANFKPTKENTMTTVATKPAAPKKGFDKKTAAANYSAAVKGTAAPAKAKAAKAAAPAKAKTAKPAVKAVQAKSSGKTTKAAPAKAKAKATATAKASTKPVARGAYAGKAITKPTTCKEALDAVRDGTFRKALMQHIAKFKTTDEAIGSSFDFNKEERIVATIDIKVAESLGIIKVS